MIISEYLEKKENFSNLESIIADYLLDQQQLIENQSARYIAKQNFTTPSAVTRLCQKIGFNGFNDFKKAFIEEIHYFSSHFNHINPNYPFEYHDKNMTIANKLGHLYHGFVDDTLSLLHHDTLQACINQLNKAKTIYVCSSGVQIDLAYTFKDKMLKIGKNVIIESKMDAAYYTASFCDKDSLFLMISYSGETDILLRTAYKLKERDIKMIGITSYGENTLSKLSDYNLYVSTREKLIDNLGNFSMNISTLLLLDTLYANIFNDNYQENFDKKTKSAHGFEKYRRSNNPILDDENKRK